VLQAREYGPTPHPFDVFTFRLIVKCTKEFGGALVSKNGVAIDLEKLDRTSKLPFPTTKKPFEVFGGWWVIIKGSYTCLQQKHVL
jgi:hypothetical protein